MCHILYSSHSFDEYRFLSNLQISPKADYVLYTVAHADLLENNYPTNLWAYDAKTQTAKQLTTSQKDGSAIWLEDHRVLFSSRRGECDPEETVFYTIDVRGGEASRAFTVPLPVTKIVAVEGERYLLSATYDPRKIEWEQADASQKKELKKQKEKENWTELDEIPFWFNGEGYTNKVRQRLYWFDADTSSLTPLTDETTQVADFILHSDKRTVVYVWCDYDSVMPLQQKVAIFDLVSREHKKYDPIPGADIHYADFWKDDIVLLASEGKHQGLNEDPHVYRMSKDGEATRITDDNFCMSYGSSVGSDLRYGGGSPVKADGDNLYFIATVGYHAQLFRMEPSGEVFPLITKEGSVDSFDVQNGVFYFVGMHKMLGQELYDQIGKKLTTHNDGLEDPLPIERFEFESRGTLLTGFAIAPEGIGEGELAPAILTIHGGPKTVYGTILHHEMQMLAKSGFYVFYTNPHGSDGYGREFMDIRGKYGTIDYDDLMACVDGFLATFPDADPERLGVMGGSYGGFMTNWIIGHTDRFKAACSQRSISNWVSFFGTSDIGYCFTTDQIAADPWTDPEKLWESSPIRYANRVTTPTLFIHSDQDYRCWLPEGLQMYTALKYFGVPTRMVVFHGENHELSRSGKPMARKKRLDEILTWFTKYLS